MKKSLTLNEWENVTNRLSLEFIERYFGGDMSDVYWIAKDIGGVLVVNDYFFDLSDIVDFIKYDYSKKKMFDYYDYRLKLQMENKEGIINIKNYKKIKK